MADNKTFDIQIERSDSSQLVGAATFILTGCYAAPEIGVKIASALEKEFTWAAQNPAITIVGIGAPLMILCLYGAHLAERGWAVTQGHYKIAPRNKLNKPKTP